LGLPLFEIMDAIDIELCNGCKPIMVIRGLECLAENVFADWLLPGFAVDELALKRKLSVEAGEVRVNCLPGDRRRYTSQREGSFDSLGFVKPKLPMLKRTVLHSK
jgi:hypothetical protein